MMDSVTHDWKGLADGGGGGNLRPTMSMRPDRLVFLHNPKAGGTAVASSLRSMFKREEIAPVFDNSPDERDPGVWPQIRTYRYIGGHFGYEVVRGHIPDSSITTNFRDPVARTASLYTYWRELDFGGLPEAMRVRSGPAFAHALSFADFIRSDDPYLSLYLDNFHTRQLLGSGMLPRRVSILDMLWAKRRIRRMPWFYVCEEPNASTEWLQRAFGVAAIGVENRSRARIPMTSDDAKVIRARNWADASLHAFATAMLLGRIR